MNKRKLLTGMAAAGVFSAGFGTAVYPANAELRTLTVTLLGGKTIQVQVDVPPGTPLDQIKLPNIPTPIIGMNNVALSVTVGFWTRHRCMTRWRRWTRSR